MLFNSIEFLIFFPIVFLFYFALPHKFRWIILLGASYYFYMAWKPEYIILIIISTMIDYTAALQMGKQKNRKKRRKYLFLSLFGNLGMLFLFKYFNFFNDSLRTIFIDFNIKYNIPDFSLLLPMGISFYTFQTLSYTIDVYRGKKKPEKHFGIFALYVSFFPQLVAGPIERSERLLPQFYTKKKFNYERTVYGLKRMMWGMFKKVVIADRLAEYVNRVYNNPENFEGFSFIIATIFFAFQIYCDFSGYSDIAIGSAKILGFDLMENFKRPYFSKSIAEFWKRWHISLSTWFRDYLYISLGGNRVSRLRHYFNLFFTFLVSGLWHGANWTFIIWGMLHGFYLIFGIIFLPLKKKIVKYSGLEKMPFINKIVQVTITNILVLFAWIFFRANNISDAFYIIANLFTGLENIFNLEMLRNAFIKMKLYQGHLLIIVLSLVLMETVHILSRKRDFIDHIKNYPLLIRWSMYYLILFFIVIFGKFGTYEFIYFQF